MLSIPCAIIECKPLRAELVGSNRCTASGITATGQVPVLALCRELIAAGFDPTTPIECYRGDTLALWTRSIGKAARLRVAAHGVGFEAVPKCTGAPPVAQMTPEAVELGGDP